MAESDCPGRFRCHGPASWCDQCGDVDLTCDDPACAVHLRLAERTVKFHMANLRYTNAKAEYDQATDEMLEAQRQLSRFLNGNVIMVGRKA